MWNGMLPIGSVVLLKAGEIPLMVVGLCQTTPGEDGSIGPVYDYVGVPYPIGYTQSDEMLQFDHDAVERVLAIGFMNEDMLEYMPHIQNIMDGLRDGSLTIEDVQASLAEEEDEETDEAGSGDGT